MAAKFHNAKRVLSVDARALLARELVIYAPRMSPALKTALNDLLQGVPPRTRASKAEAAAQRRVAAAAAASEDDEAGAAAITVALPHARRSAAFTRTKLRPRDGVLLAGVLTVEDCTDEVGHACGAPTAAMAPRQIMLFWAAWGQVP